MQVTLKSLHRPVVVTIRGSGDHDEIQQARVEHLFGIGEAAEVGGELTSRVDALWIGVTHGGECEPGCGLHRLIVFVADGAVGEETDSDFWHV